MLVLAPYLAYWLKIPMIGPCLDRMSPAAVTVGRSVSSVSAMPVTVTGGPVCSSRMTISCPAIPPLHPLSSSEPFFVVDCVWRLKMRWHVLAERGLPIRSAVCEPGAGAGGVGGVVSLSEMVIEVDAEDC